MVLVVREKWECAGSQVEARCFRQKFIARNVRLLRGTCELTKAAGKP
jgi:hypothetical protein